MPAAQRALHHAATVLVGLSGVVYGWMKLVLPEPEDPFTLVRHPLQPWALDLHVLAAPLFLLALGIILREHILARLADPRRRRGRRSGVLAALLLVPMIASGYLLQTATMEWWRMVLLITHLTSGVLFLGIYLVEKVCELPWDLKHWPWMALAFGVGGYFAVSFAADHPTYFLAF